MSYVVTKSLIKCNFMDCVDLCSADCF